MYQKVLMAAMILFTACAVQTPGTEKQKVAFIVTQPPAKLDITKLVVGRLTLTSQIYGSRSGTCFPIQKTTTKTGIKLRLLTARHVVRDYVDIKKLVNEVEITQRKEVLRADGLELFRLEKLILKVTDIKVLRDNKGMDTVLIEVPIPADLDVQVFSLSTVSPKVGQEVLSFGCQAGIIPTFTYGLVCRKTGADMSVKEEAWITSANVFGGASGGPIVDKQTGVVIGLTSALAMAGSLTPTPITHVHLFIDASKIRNWLNSV